jgi:hypothetical protein
MTMANEMTEGPEDEGWPSARQAYAILMDMFGPLGHDLELWEWRETSPDWRHEEYVCVHCKACDSTYDTYSIGRLIVGPPPEECPGPEEEAPAEPRATGAPQDEGLLRAMEERLAMEEWLADPRHGTIDPSPL